MTASNADEAARTPSRASGLRERLAWDPSSGAVSDGPRRYLLMRPDVLMGLFLRLPKDHRDAALAAFTESVAEHGADSLRAYRRSTGNSPEAMLQTTAAAAADLGWGRWRLTCRPGRLDLRVDASPFAAGFGPAAQAVCAPVTGMLRALAAMLRVDTAGAAGEPAPGAPAAPADMDGLDVREVRCRALGHDCCEFVAHWPLPPDGRS